MRCLSVDPISRAMRSMPLLALAILSFAPTSPLVAQEPGSVEAALVAAARDYIDGFAAADTARVRRSVHPDVAKRLVSGTTMPLSNQTADMLVGMTGMVRASANPPVTPADSIRIIAREGNMAMVRIGAPMWVDYLQLGRFGDRWQIVNVLWELR